MQLTELLATTAASKELYRWAHADSLSSRTFTTIDPARGELLAEVDVAGPEEVKRVVEAAYRRVGDLVANDGGRAWSHSRAGGSDPARAQQRARRVANARYRQADPGDVACRHPLGSRLSRILRRPGTHDHPVIISTSATPSSTPVTSRSVSLPALVRGTIPSR